MGNPVIFTCVGDVRGQCDTHHHTIGTARRCIQRDRDGCASQGGYSDREIVAIEDGQQRELTDVEQMALDEIADQGPLRK